MARYIDTFGRGFHEFRPGDNPYELGREAVPRLAQLTGIELGEWPTDVEIQEKLFENWDTERFKAQVGVGDEARQRVADVIADSGIQEEFDPRRIDGLTAIEFKTAIFGGGDWNEIARRTGKMADLVERGYKFDSAVLLGGGRQMSSPTEAGNAFVVDWQANHNGNYPTEVDYMHTVTAPLLGQMVTRVREVYAQEPAEFKGLVDEASGLLDDGNVLVVQNAPYGSAFSDVRPVVEDVRLYFATDGIRVARTDEHEADPFHWQEAFSAPSALARWVKAIHDINTGTPNS